MEFQVRPKHTSHSFQCNYVASVTPKIAIPQITCCKLKDESALEGILPMCVILQTPQAQHQHTDFVMLIYLACYIKNIYSTQLLLCKKKDSSCYKSCSYSNILVSWSQSIPWKSNYTELCHNSLFQLQCSKKAFTLFSFFS